MKKILISLLAVFPFLSYNCNQDSGPTITNTGGSTNHAPNLPSNPNPPDSATNVNNVNVLLSWTCSDPDQGDTLRYDVYISSVNPPTYLIAQNLLNTVYGLGIIDPNMTFYWKVVAKDNHGASRTGNTWRFRTAP